MEKSVATKARTAKAPSTGVACAKIVRRKVTVILCRRADDSTLPLVLRARAAVAALPTDAGACQACRRLRHARHVPAARLRFRGHGIVSAIYFSGSSRTIVRRAAPRTR